MLSKAVLFRGSGHPRSTRSHNGSKKPIANSRNTWIANIHKPLVCWSHYLPPWKLTYLLENDGWKMIHFLLTWSLFRGHSWIFPTRCTNGMFSQLPPVQWMYLVTLVHEFGWKVPTHNCCCCGNRNRKGICLAMLVILRSYSWCCTRWATDDRYKWSETTLYKWP